MSTYELSKLSYYKNPISLTCMAAVASCRNFYAGNNVAIVNL